jgi:hypothetical protein
VFEFDAEAKTLGEHLGNLDSGWNDFLANAVPWNGSNAIV